MKKVMLAVSTLALVATAAPAFAQNQDNDNSVNGAAGGFGNDTTVVNDLIDMFVQDNAADSYQNSSQDNDQDNDGNGSLNGNNTLIATQTLNATNTNRNMDQLVGMNDADEASTAIDYESGNNSVRGNAFAAYAGILNASWNTGINANTQSATNIAASGNVNFGAQGAAPAPQ